MNRPTFTCTVFWSGEDNEYVGTCKEYPSLAWVSPDPLIALQGIGLIAYETWLQEREIP